MTTVSIGVAGALGPDTIAQLAPAVEAAGFHALWVNDVPSGDSIAALAAAANVTSRLVLATGVVPIDRRPADEIVQAVRDAELPQERLVLGIGSGRLRVGALDAVRDAASTLHAETSAHVVVGALGPRMREVGAYAGGVLLNWVTTDAAAAQAAELKARSPAALAIVYARTALDDAGWRRLREEAETYGSFPQYAANFARQGVTPLDTVLPRAGDESIATGVAEYSEGVDEVVLRAVTAGDDVDDYRAFISAAAEQLALAL